jgi:hypothetical protein
MQVTHSKTNYYSLVVYTIFHLLFSLHNVLLIFPFSLYNFLLLFPLKSATAMVNIYTRHQFSALPFKCTVSWFTCLFRLHFNTLSTAHESKICYVRYGKRLNIPCLQSSLWTHATGLQWIQTYLEHLTLYHILCAQYSLIYKSLSHIGCISVFKVTSLQKVAFYSFFIWHSPQT